MGFSEETTDFFSSGLSTKEAMKRSVRAITSATNFVAMLRSL